MSKNIPVTQPFLPPLSEFIPALEQIWENKWLTNNGPFHQDFERALCEYLGVDYISLFANGTLALVTALQALRVTGEVITTPYSFVATSHALIWNDLTPVFVDIKPGSFNMDPAKIEAAITSRTTAIMPVHCYSEPCAIQEIQRIADNYGLHVIYDAAHAFGVKYQGQSILQHGDMSVLSFHATKVFNTFEGGAIVSRSKKTKQRVDYLKNFGFADEVTIVAPGINGKMSEINAAFGLLQLKYVDNIIAMRATIDSRYRQELSGVVGISIPKLSLDTQHNYPYFPILVDSDYFMSRDQLYDALREQGIMARRYFYPLISNMPMYRGFPSSVRENLPQANYVADRVLCLPIYPDLELADQERIISIIRGK
ncbi:DegT/DnrJ/EryC1/StrS family aminotransferase [Shewanella baltica]|uniref:DegT/DnrJ/EryC1/StrS family aminotransferase n=1 Tax=Shewanella baltica TaxID=62322 RepID=UPI0024B95E9D|nr:DegT/DnrJ/EryC1/StrS family aminotransferase [Shewanella baltica]